MERVLFSSMFSHFKISLSYPDEIFVHSSQSVFPPMVWVITVLGEETTGIGAIGVAIMGVFGTGGALRSLGDEALERVEADCLTSFPRV